MDLPIQAHGLLVPDAPWEGAVVSRHSRAINVLHPRGLLIGMVASLGQMSPFSFTVEGFFGEGALAAAARIVDGTRCRRTGEGLIVGAHRLDLSTSRPWEGRLPGRLAGSIAEPGILAARLRAALAEGGADDGLREVLVPGSSQTIFGRRARELLDSPSGAAERLRRLSRLVGLGIGFTPSGDDFISGVLLARSMVGEAGPTIDAEELHSRLQGTNAAGRTLLTAALAGGFPAYLLQFAAAVGEVADRSIPGDGDAAATLRSAVRAAAAHGETSGTDAVTGFTWYLALVGGPQFV